MKKLLLALVALAALAVGGLFFYTEVLRDDPPEKLDFTDPGDGEGDSDGTTDPGTTPETAAAGDLDGSWSPTDESLVGYRVLEDFASGLTNSEAVGRTSAVSGSFTLEGTTVPDATFTADLTGLESDDSRRDGQVQGRILDTANFPEAVFTLTEPIELGTLPPSGEEVTATATGELELHGVTKEVTFEVRAKWAPDRIEVVGEIPIVFADYDIDNPSNAVVSVRDDGLLEFLLVLTPAA